MVVAIAALTLLLASSTMAQNKPDLTVAEKESFVIYNGKTVFGVKWLECYWPLSP